MARMFPVSGRVIEANNDLEGGVVQRSEYCHYVIYYSKWNKFIGFIMGSFFAVLRMMKSRDLGRHLFAMVETSDLTDNK